MFSWKGQGERVCHSLTSWHENCIDIRLVRKLGKYLKVDNFGKGVFEGLEQ